MLPCIHVYLCTCTDIHIYKYKEEIIGNKLGKRRIRTRNQEFGGKHSNHQTSRHYTEEKGQNLGLYTSQYTCTLTLFTNSLVFTKCKCTERHINPNSSLLFKIGLVVQWLEQWLFASKVKQLWPWLVLGWGPTVRQATCIIPTVAKKQLKKEAQMQLSSISHCQ